MNEADVRRAKEALKRKAYEQGGSGAVKQSEKLREKALNDMIRIKNK